MRALKKGMDDAHAKGYGLWVAKVVASGGGRRAESGAQGWQGILKNVALMALLVAAVDVASRLVNRFRRDHRQRVAG